MADHQHAEGHGNTHLLVLVFGGPPRGNYFGAACQSKVDQRGPVTWASVDCPACLAVKPEGPCAVCGDICERSCPGYEREMGALEVKRLLIGGNVAIQYLSDRTR